MDPAPKPLLEAPNVEKVVEAYLRQAYKGQRMSLQQREDRAQNFLAGLAKGTDIAISIGRNEDPTQAAKVMGGWMQKMSDFINNMIAARKERERTAKKAIPATEHYANPDIIKNIENN